MRKIIIPIVGVFTLLIGFNTSINNFKTNNTLVEDKKHFSVKVTTYTIDPKQTDNTPLITASGFNLHPKNPRKHRIIAISRDLKKSLKYGDKVYLKGTGKYDGVYYVHDLMNKRFRKRIDILINPNDKPTMFKNAEIYIL